MSRRDFGLIFGLAGVLVAAPASAEELHAKDALARAARKNPTLAAAVADLTQANAAVTSEEARYDALLALTLNGTHTRNPNLTMQGVNVGTTDVIQGDATLKKTLGWGTQLSAAVGVTWTRTATPVFLGAGTGGAASATPVILTLGPGYLASVKLGVTQPLLRGAGKEVTLAQLRQAEVQRASAELTRDRQASSLARDLLTAYWELWYASTAVDVDRTAVETAKKQRDDADARRQTGSLAAADVLTFETQLATKEETLRQAEMDRRQRVNELTRLMGDEAKESSDLVAADQPAEETQRELAGDLQRQAEAQSPELREQEAAVRLAEVKEKTAADTYRPKLDLDAYVQAQGLGNDEIPAAAQQLAGLGALSAHVGLSFESPLSKDRLVAEQNRAFATTDAARQRREATRQSLHADVDTAIQRQQMAKDRIALAERTVDIATRQLDAEEARFTSGSGTAIQVVAAQDSLQSARLRLARARADHLQAHLALAHLVGALTPSLRR